MGHGLGLHKCLHCDGCHARIGCNPCCRCTPKRVCVSACGDHCSGQPVNEETPWDCDEQWYEWSLGTVTFEKVDGTCYAVLTSETLGLVIDGEDDFRAKVEIECCEDLDVTFESIDWSAVDYGCTSVDVRVKAIDAIVFDPECGDCGGCRCFPREFCLNYFDGVEDVYFRAIWNAVEEYWEGGGWTISVVVGDMGQCVLHLAHDSLGIVSGDQPMLCVLGDDPLEDEVRTWTLSTGTLQLNHPSPCGVYCGCPGLPRTLYATITDITCHPYSDGCGPVDGAVVELNWEPANCLGTGRWKGSLTFEDCDSIDTVTITLACGPGTGCSEMELTVGGALGGVAASPCNESVPDCTCCPFERVWEGIECDGCEFNSGTEVRITITE